MKTPLKLITVIVLGLLINLAQAEPPDPNFALNVIQVFDREGHDVTRSNGVESEIESAVLAHAFRIDLCACYSNEPVDSIMGSILVELAIEQARASQAKLISSTLQNPRFEQCVRVELEQVEFDQRRRDQLAKARISLSFGNYYTRPILDEEPEQERT